MKNHTTSYPGFFINKANTHYLPPSQRFLYEMILVILTRGCICRHRFSVSQTSKNYCQFLFDMGYNGLFLSIVYRNMMRVFNHAVYQVTAQPLVFTVWASPPSQPGGVLIRLPLWLSCLGERQLASLLMATMYVCKDRKSPKYLPQVIRGLFCTLQSNTEKSGSDCLLFVQFTPTPCPLFSRKIRNRNHRPAKSQIKAPQWKHICVFSFDF